MESNVNTHKHWRYDDVYVIAHVIERNYYIQGQAAASSAWMICAFFFFLIGVAFFQIFNLHPIQSRTGAIWVHVNLLADIWELQLKLQDVSKAVLEGFVNRPCWD